MSIQGGRSRTPWSRQSRLRIFGPKPVANTIPLAPGTTPRPEARLACYEVAELDVGGRRQLGLVADVSPSGAFVFANPTPAVGSDVALVLLQPGSGEALRRDARVVRATADGVGLRFAAPDADLPRRVAALSPS